MSSDERKLWIAVYTARMGWCGTADTLDDHSARCEEHANRAVAAFRRANENDTPDEF